VSPQLAGVAEGSVALGSGVGWSAVGLGSGVVGVADGLGADGVAAGVLADGVAVGLAVAGLEVLGAAVGFVAGRTAARVIDDWVPSSVLAAVGDADADGVGVGEVGRTGCVVASGVGSITTAPTLFPGTGALSPVGQRLKTARPTPATPVMARAPTVLVMRTRWWSSRWAATVTPWGCAGDDCCQSALDLHLSQEFTGQRGLRHIQSGRSRSIPGQHRHFRNSGYVLLDGNDLI
jgi:hypothetical protein